jgi:hypothetical protein
MPVLRTEGKVINVFTDAIAFVNSDYVRYDTNVQLPWEVGCFYLKLLTQYCIVLYL